MSFFKKFGKSKTAEYPGISEKKPKKGKRSASFHVKSRGKADEQPETENDELRAAETEKEKDKERKKYKDMSGILLGGAQESRAYPTFNVHYLGRIPTASEYGREAVEDPVNQLCKLREKQKLQRVFLNFNVEGLYCREVSGPFLKPKKDGFNMHIPLHHITYGVGCVGHPTVFACIAKMNDDPQPENQVLVLHAFVCDKPETTQAITYWQLQAYIEAYEDLKRKRILRSRRKQAMDGLSNQKGTDMEDVPEEGQTQLFGEKNQQYISQNNNTKSNVTAVKHNTKEEKPVSANGKSHITVRETHSGAVRARPDKLPNNHSSNAPQDVHVVADVHSTKTVGPKATARPDKLPNTRSSNAPQDVHVVADVHSTKTVGPKATARPDKPPNTHSSNAPQDVHVVADVHSIKTVGPKATDQKPPVSTQPRQESRRPTASQKRTDSLRVAGKIHDVRKGVPTESVASRLSSSSSSGGGSPLASPTAKTNKTFEHRIGELNTLVNMDAEKLKSLMITDHPTLARRIYYRATVDESGLFQQGSGVPVDEETEEDASQA